MNIKEREIKMKKGQITVFVIVAIVIVFVILVAYLLYNKGVSTTGSRELSPNDFIKNCVEPKIKEIINNLSSQGGYRNPEGYIEYNGKKIKYLCYTNRDYDFCIVQQPLIKGHFEKELNEELSPKINQCIEQFKEEYKNRGYEIEVGRVNSTALIELKKIKVEINSPILITKGEDKRTYNKFNIEIDSSIYDLLMITQSILSFETTLGESETVLYMQYYPNLKIQKIRLNEGTKIYILEDVVTKEKFTFASRSLYLPPGGIS